MDKKIYLLVLLGLALVVYGNSLHSPFMLDDYAFFAQFQNTGVLDHFIPDPHQQWGIDSANTQCTYYRPMAHIVPHIIYLFMKNNAMGYHVVNVILLALAAWCMALMLSVVMPGVLALGAAILFMVHPINGVMVNYITASVFSVQVICMCMSLYYLISVQSLDPRQKLSGGTLSSGLFLLALLCHETSFMIPFYAVLLCLMQSLDIKSALSRTKGLWITLAAYMLFRSFFVPLSHSLLYSITVTGLKWEQAMASIVSLLGWYVGRLFIPKDIFLMFSQPFVYQGDWDWVTFAVAFGVFACIGMQRLWRINTKAVLFFLWFLVGLFPIFLGAFASPPLGALLEPHWFIPATVGLFAGVMCLLAQLLPSKFWQKVFFSVIVSVLMVFSWSNNQLWSDETRLYERWLVINPQFKAIHYFLANIYDRQNQYDKAREHYQQSLLNRYKDWMVYLALGKLDLKQQKVEDARKDLHKAYELEPRESDILNALGVVEFSDQNYLEAKKWFEEAARVNRFNMEPRMNLAIVFLQMQDVPGAIAQYEGIVRARPDFAPAVQALARLRGY